ncbi:hypothetical protein RF11_06492 [Thelohanellus kitauei]|uniref:Reverse transcriptase RNase H-like domain-containing protein n=1 Tax=Thelohanellus kitauei TaxID=669202 RepID=A0A0C2NDG0_THEKT|nr:hypothetical protein RF11_06492 [Thelohanellus kitauei]
MEDGILGGLDKSSFIDKVKDIKAVSQSRLIKKNTWCPYHRSSFHDDSGCGRNLRERRTIIAKTISSKDQILVKTGKNKRSDYLGPTIPENSMKVTKEFYVDADATFIAIGPEQYQLQGTISFFSKLLTLSEVNNTNIERDLFVIVKALDLFKSSIFESTIIVGADHANLIHSPDAYTSLKQRWILLIEDTVVADTSSRCNYIDEGDDQSPITTLGPFKYTKTNIIGPISMREELVIPKSNELVKLTPNWDDRSRNKKGAFSLCDSSSEQKLMDDKE